MKNLNSKKARQELSNLFSSINTLEWKMDEYIARNRKSMGTSKENYEGFDKAQAEQNKLIIEMVEVYGIPNTRYEDAKRDEEEAA